MTRVSLHHLPSSFLLSRSRVGIDNEAQQSASPDRLARATGPESLGVFRRSPSAANVKVLQGVYDRGSSVSMSLLFPSLTRPLTHSRISTSHKRSTNLPPFPPRRTLPRRLPPQIILPRTPYSHLPSLFLPTREGLSSSYQCGMRAVYPRGDPPPVKFGATCPPRRSVRDVAYHSQQCRDQLDGCE